MVQDIPGMVIYIHFQLAEAVVRPGSRFDLMFGIGPGIGAVQIYQQLQAFGFDPLGKAGNFGGVVAAIGRVDPDPQADDVNP